jgi:hypothetical protein
MLSRDLVPIVRILRRPSRLQNSSLLDHAREARDRSIVDDRRLDVLPRLDLRQVAADQMRSKAESHNSLKRRSKRQANRATDWARNRYRPLPIVGVDNLAVTDGESRDMLSGIEGKDVGARTEAP